MLLAWHPRLLSGALVCLVSLFRFLLYGQRSLRVLCAQPPSVPHTSAPRHSRIQLRAAQALAPLLPLDSAATPCVVHALTSVTLTVGHLPMWLWAPRHCCAR